MPAITPDWSSLEAQAGFAMHSGGMLAGWKFSNIKNGVFSEFFHVNDADGNLAHLPEGMDITEACMLSDMVPTGFHGAELADVQFGDTVRGVGIGPVGLMAVAGAALRGAARILAVGTRPVCVEAARKYGATCGSGMQRMRRRSGIRNTRAISASSRSAARTPASTLV